MKSLRLLAVILLLIGVPTILNAAKAPIAAPFINPLGDIQAYRRVVFRENVSRDVRLPDRDGKTVQRRVIGDGWQLEVAIKGDSKAPFDELADYLSGLGGQILYRDERLLSARVQTAPHESWWAQAELRSSLYYLQVTRQDQLLSGKVHTWKVGKDHRKKFVFCTDHPGDRYQSLAVNLPAGSLTLKARTVSSFGEYERTENFQHRLDADKLTSFVLDDIPQEPGLTQWEMDWNGDAPQAEVSLTLTNTAALPTYTPGEEMGALRVRGIAYGRAMVLPEGDVAILHPELQGVSFQGDLTPDGDTLFWLPAGLWRVQVTPKGTPCIDHCDTRLVPVAAGRMTLVDMPYSLTTAFTGTEGGVKLLEAGEDGKEGTVTFSLQDAAAREIAPSADNLVIAEGGVDAKLIGVERLKTPPSVVLLLDSSGSMKGQMKGVLAAARRFIEALPEKTRIRVVDFDTRPKVLLAKRQDELVAKLAKIHADGATALYDSVLEGLQLLSGEERPNLLLFTDGLDANWNDTGPGSKATKQEVFEAAGAAGVPLYTIGFGATHDRNTLERLASLSGGRYYPVADRKALDEIFAQINENLGNTFEAHYLRPRQALPADVPVVSLVVDTSNSMDWPPSRCKSCNYRLDKIKGLLHDFVLRLPDPGLVQLQNFSDSSTIAQVMTSRKEELLRALGDLQANGGTDILGSVKTAFETLRPVPSARRILVYVTDAALDVPDKDRKEFSTLLEKIRDEKISTIWIGMGIDKGEAVFRHAAALSGGRYLLSEDPGTLEKTFAQVLEKIDAGSGGPERTAVRVTLRQRLPQGQVRTYSASGLFPLQPPPRDSRAAVPQSVRYRLGPVVSQYDASVATLVTGDDMPVRDAQVRKRVPLEVQGANRAVKISVEEALFFSRLKGIDAPRGQRFLALTMAFDNILPEQKVTLYPDGSNHPAAWMSAGPETGAKVVMMRPDYLVPDLTSHLFLNLNNAAMLPVSPATWLAAEPLVPAGARSLTVKPGESVKGACLFLVPDAPLEQASLHFYDVSYGHVTIPLVGTVERQDEPLVELPTTAPARLSDAFSLQLRAVKDLDSIDTVKAQSGSLFRVVEADLTSRVQALLDIDPSKRFWLLLPTAAGPLYSPVAPQTAFLPYGFVRPALMAPGSNNRIRFAFQVPLVLRTTPGELLVEIKGEDPVLGLAPTASRPAALAQPVERVEARGMTLSVNALGVLPKIDHRKGPWVVADITLEDQVDGGSTVLRRGFELYRDDYRGPAETADIAGQEKHKGLKRSAGNDAYDHYLLRPDALTGELLFGFDDSTLTPDGASRRGLVLFKLPSPAAGHRWTLKSRYFKELALVVPTTAYSSPELLVRRQDAPRSKDSTFVTALDAAVKQAVNERLAFERQAPGRTEVPRTGLDAKEPPKRPVSPPPVTTTGAERFAGLTTLEKVRSALKEVRWLPAHDAHGRYRYAPAAVLTQGWGSEADLANLVEKVLIRNGIAPERRRVEVTAKGCKTLAELAGFDKISVRTLPALAYQDAAGSHLLVLPFLKDLDALSGLVVLPEHQPSGSDSSETARLTVNLLVVPKQVDRNQQLRDMGAALAGNASSGKPKTLTVLDYNLDLSDLSLDAVDLGYTIDGRGQGDLYRAVLETSGGRFTGNRSVDGGLYQIVGEQIELRLPGDKCRYETVLEKGEKVTGLFHTLGINLPDLPPTAATRLAKIAGARHDRSSHPDELSALRWQGRTIIDRFLAGQTRYENELARRLKVTVGRSERSRCLVVTMRKGDTGPLKTSIDLLRVDNQTHLGKKDACHAFNIFSGLFASELEARVLPEGERISLGTVWAMLPSETNMVLISSRNKRQSLTYMKKHHYPPSVIKRLEETDRMVLFPSRPATLKGQERWAWLEIDPRDYRTIAVLDSGEHGAMVEVSMGNWGVDSGQFVVGAFIGVDAALWAVSSFSLALEDHEKLMRQAETYAAGISKGFAVEEGPLSWGVGGGFLPTLSAGHMTFGFGSGKVSATPDLLGFGNGYKAGVALYFSLAD